MVRVLSAFNGWTYWISFWHFSCVYDPCACYLETGVLALAYRLLGSFFCRSKPYFHIGSRALFYVLLAPERFA